MIEEKEIKLINDIIYNAQLNGGDAGGSYYSNEDGLKNSMDTFLRVTGATKDYAIKEKIIYGEAVFQFINKKDKLIF